MKKQSTTVKKKTVKAKGWALIHRGTFIAAFRFKPKRVRIPAEIAFGDKGYYAWTDCNGPRYSKEIIVNTIEGSMNAICVPCTITYDIK